jgi:hypothetical protein
MFRFAGCLLGSGLAIAACSSADENGGSVDPNGDGGSPFAEGEGGPGVTPDNGDHGGFGDPVDGGLRDAGLNACANSSQRGRVQPLDMTMMLDSSGSMWLRTQSGEFKWNAVKGALTSFLNDPASSGMGIGLQYFPLFRNGTPNVCTQGSHCGAAGPCLLKACSNFGTYCDVDADCPGNSQCSTPLGQCHDEGEIKCRTDADCKTAVADYGKCDPMIATFCFSEQESCNVPDYSTPAVPVAILPGAAAPIIDSLNGHWPNGFTPTSAALQGLEAQATAHLAANPGHAVAAVLVTDGLPSNCDTNIANIANVSAKALAAGIKTYVIGVFAPSEEATARANLDKIAAAGGTSSAFLINTNQSVAQAFLAALSTIRGSGLPCEFSLPIPKDGTPDYGKVNVQYNLSTGGTTVIPYVPNAGACDSGGGGWHYDVDPAGGGKPEKVVLCKATCDSAKGDQGGATVDIVQGCKTIVR